MDSFLRQSAVFLASVALIFFCSCERHHPDELPAEGHATLEAGDRAHDDHAEVKGHHENPTHGASPGVTPAEFFPESTPH